MTVYDMRSGALTVLKKTSKSCAGFSMARFFAASLVGGLFLTPLVVGRRSELVADKIVAPKQAVVVMSLNPVAAIPERMLGVAPGRLGKSCKTRVFWRRGESL